MTQEHQIDLLVENLFRREAGRMTAVLTRMFGAGRMDLAEDVVQETLAKALMQWRFKGVPENPSAWLYRVAKNHALDLLRRDTRLEIKHEELGRWLARSDETVRTAEHELAEAEIKDDQLRMMFTCCHPALTRESQVALILKTLCGFSSDEIARAFLCDEPTIAQRIVRAKRTIRNRGIELTEPDRTELPERLDSVLQSLYLLFNEGYNAHSGEELTRGELCSEAIYLASLLAEHPWGDLPRTHALLALMLLQASRLGARTDEQGELLLLEEQDRTRWDRKMIGQGFCELERAMTGDHVSQFHLEAGIAACHAAAISYEATDWAGILKLYDELLQLNDSAVFRLNRAVAVSRLQGPDAGIAELDRIPRSKGMEQYHLLQATYGALYAELGDQSRSQAAYREAEANAGSEAERRFLRRKLSSVTTNQL